MRPELGGTCIRGIPVLMMEQLEDFLAREVPLFERETLTGRYYSTSSPVLISPEDLKLTGF